jgi:hypothetical protein
MVADQAWLTGTRLRGFELRNVVTKYRFERSRRFPESSPILTTRDYSRLSCGAGIPQLGPSQNLGRDTCAGVVLHRLCLR